MSFTRLLHPRSIVVFGGGVAAELIRQCDRMGYDGEIWPVHPRKTEILGRTVYRSVADLPASPDAAYVGVNRHLTVDIVGELAARDAGGAICYATGFTEAGAEGAELEQRLLAASAEMPLIGPNCYGMLNYLDGAMLWPDQQGGRRVEQGVAIITMSSNVAFNLTMQRRGLPVAYMLSLGNKLKLDLHDAIRIFAADQRVSAIGLYLEGITDPFAFEAAAREARRSGKPIVALKAGRSATSQQIVLSHTASLAGADELMSALFERAGVARICSLEALIEALKVLHVLGPLAGGRIGAMSTSGGDLTLLADAMIGSDLSLPPLSHEGQQRLRQTVHERMVAANPLDFQMFDWNDEERLTATFSAFIADGFDLSLCLLDYPREDLCDQSEWDGAERGFVRAGEKTGARCGLLSTFTDTMCESVAERLMSAGVVPLAGIDTGLAGIQAAVDVGRAWSRETCAPLLACTDTQSDSPSQVLDEAESKEVLAACGVPVPPSRVVGNGQEAATAAQELGFPVVVKALGVVHKTDAGGVRLSLHSSDEVVAAVAEMSHLGQRFLIEKMVGGVVAELIVGVARDLQFGPYLVLGGGGILVELVKDSVSLLLPLTREQVLRSLEGLQCAPLLHGFRGSAAADLDACTEAVLAIAGLVERDPTAIIELDINPLLVLAEGKGVIAADALLRVRARISSCTEGAKA
jgi:acyl-CoA synthetase (NDP forming)